MSDPFTAFLVSTFLFVGAFVIGVVFNLGGSTPVMGGLYFLSFAWILSVVAVSVTVYQGGR